MHAIERETLPKKSFGDMLAIHKGLHSMGIKVAQAAGGSLTGGSAGALGKTDRFLAPVQRA